jgi:hypothetical protein
LHPNLTRDLHGKLYRLPIFKRLTCLYFQVPGRVSLECNFLAKMDQYSVQFNKFVTEEDAEAIRQDVLAEANRLHRDQAAAAEPSTAE